MSSARFGMFGSVGGQPFCMFGTRFGAPCRSIISNEYRVLLTLSTTFCMFCNMFVNGHKNDPKRGMSTMLPNRRTCRTHLEIAHE